jgi:hypothetical protein
VNFFSFFDDQVEDFFLQKEGDFRICNKQRSSDIKNREISLICENTPNLKKIFENMESLSSHV